MRRTRVLPEASDLMGYKKSPTGYNCLPQTRMNLLYVKFKEHSCITLTLTIYYTIVSPMVGRNNINKLISYQNIESQYNKVMYNLSLQNTRPYIITLNEGDVLFVPRHWWHFVYTHSESSISINTWLEMVSISFDNQISRLKQIKRDKHASASNLITLKELYCDTKCNCQQSH